jgi:hypothetical protein
MCFLQCSIVATCLRAAAGVEAKAQASGKAFPHGRQQGVVIIFQTEIPPRN